MRIVKNFKEEVEIGDKLINGIGKLFKKHGLEKFFDKKKMIGTINDASARRHITEYGSMPVDLPKNSVFNAMFKSMTASVQLTADSGIVGVSFTFVWKTAAKTFGTLVITYKTEDGGRSWLRR